MPTLAAIRKQRRSERLSALRQGALADALLAAQLGDDVLAMTPRAAHLAG